MAHFMFRSRRPHVWPDSMVSGDSLTRSSGKLAATCFREGSLKMSVRSMIMSHLDSERDHRVSRERELRTVRTTCASLNGEPDDPASHTDSVVY